MTNNNNKMSESPFLTFSNVFKGNNSLFNDIYSMKRNEVDFFAIGYNEQKNSANSGQKLDLFNNGNSNSKYSLDNSSQCSFDSSKNYPCPPPFNSSLNGSVNSSSISSSINSSHFNDFINEELKESKINLISYEFTRLAINNKNENKINPKLMSSLYKLYH